MATGWDNGLNQDYNRKLGGWFANRLGARQQLREMFNMSMHKSFRNDTQTPAGQVQLQGKTLQKEIEDYQQAMQNCRCNDQPVEKCDTCPNKVCVTKENTNCR